VTDVPEVTPWTKAWWDSLPNAYRMADPEQKGLGYPLLRFMDGPGKIAGELRDLSDDGWEGRLTNPATTPDGAVYWLAQMLGVSKSQRARTPQEMREYLAAITTGGRPAVGTRQAMADVVKTILTGSKMVGVVASKTQAHTIILLVRAEEVPGGILQNLIDAVRKANVVPAGHLVQAVNAQATWDQFDAAKGGNWDAFVAQAATWANADSIGVVVG
jgi:hypothetical protein